MKFAVCLLSLFMLAGTLKTAEVRNPDSPRLGEYRFPLEEIWRLDGPGDGFWGGINSLIVSGDDRLCVYDWKNRKYHILDEDGRLLHTFGRKGEGPGEIRRIEQAPVMTAGELIAVLDAPHIHFFDWNGNFVRSVRSTTGNTPVRFLDDHTFIAAPRSRQQAGGETATVERVDLDSGEKHVVSTFSLYSGGDLNLNGGRATVVFGGITPMVEVAFHQGRLIYGVSNIYRITVTDTEGRPDTLFSLDRPKRTVKREDITRRLVERAGARAPRELLERLAATLPTEQTYFGRIEVHGGLIYVFVNDFYDTHTTHVDIFSLQGEYLYQGVLATGPDLVQRGRLFAGPHLYLVLEDAEGEQALVKYRIGLPAPIVTGKRRLPLRSSSLTS